MKDAKQEHYQDEEYVAQPAKWARQRMKFHTTASELKVERMRDTLYQIQNPEEHVQQRAALFGHFPFEPEATIDEEGKLTASANPWAAQWVNDKTAAECGPRVHRDPRPELGGQGGEH